MARRSRTWLGRLAILGFVAVTTIGIWLPPIVIRATEKAYHFPDVSIDAVVEADGDLLLEERRTFDFRNGPFTFAYFDVDDPFERVRDFTMAEVVDGREVPVDPDFTWWAGDTFEAKWSYLAEDEERTWVFRYRVACAVDVYPDTAHLYWQFVGTGWAVPTDHVVVTVALPERATASTERRDRCLPDEPSGPVEPTRALEEGDVRAWGHGPLNGKVALPTPGTVRLEAREVPPASYVEGSIVFPIDSVPIAAVDGAPSLERILADEAVWADQANAIRERAATERRWVLRLGALLPLAVALCVALARLRDRAPGVPRVLEEPPEDDPVEAALVWSAWLGRLSPQAAYRAQLLRLAAIGAIELQAEGPVTDPVDVVLVRRRDADDLEDPADRDFQAMLFGSGRAALDRFSLSRPPSGRRETSGRYRAWWEGVRRGPADTLREIRTGDARIEAVAIMVAALAAAGYGAWTAIWGLGGMIGWWLLPISLACLVVGLGLIPARVDESTRMRVARLGAFRRYLRRFSDLPNAPALAVVIWERYLAWAAALGVADEVERQVVALIPTDELPPVVPGGPGGSAGIRLVHDLRRAATTLVLARSTAPSPAGSRGGGIGSSSSRSGFSGGGFSSGGGGGGGGTGGRAG